MVASFLFFSLGFMIPLTMITNFHRIFTIGDEKLRAQNEFLLIQFKGESLLTNLFFPLFFVRRFLIVFAVVVMRGHTNWQIGLIVAVNVVVFAYCCALRPYN